MTAIYTVTGLHEIAGMPAMERSKLFLGDPTLLASIPHTDNADALVSARHLKEHHGMQVRPFWEDDPDDMEGKAYHDHIAKHPTFELKMRQGVADRLATAQSNLPAGWTIVLKAGFRPLAVQYMLFDRVYDTLAAKHPEWDEATLLAETRILCSDPRIKVPPHSTGAAIDIEVYDRKTGKPVDMGAPANTHGPKGWSHSPAITKTERHRRILLLEAMLAAGFANFAYEWWHFSYGDAMWALFYDQPAAIYDLINQPV